MPRRDYILDMVDTSNSIEESRCLTASSESKCQPKISRLSQKLTGLFSKDQQIKQHQNSRLVSRRGKVNVTAANVENKKALYLADPFTTLLDAKWGWIFLAFASGFVTSWLFFGTLWWMIVKLRTRFDTASCVDNVDSWISAFLFSVETQTTIGYGGRQVTPECPEGVVCLLVQSLSGLMLSASLLGLIFAKLSRPRPRAHTIRFSKRAVVSKKDGKLCLIFRVGDIRKSQLLEVTVKLHCFHYIAGDNGSLFFNQSELPIAFSPECEPEYEVRPFFLTPLTIMHMINEQSPLYDLSAAELAQANIEFVAVLEGVVEATGMVTQGRASYLSSEVHWGHDFYPLMLKAADTPDRLEIDFSLFDHTYASSTPTCSAREQMKRKVEKKEDEDNGKTLVWIPRKVSKDEKTESR